MRIDIQEAEHLAELEDQGIGVEVYNLDGKTPALQDDGVTPITISVVGSLSTRYRKVQALNRGRVLRKATAERSANGKGTVSDEPKTPEEQDAIDEAEGAKSFEQQREAVAACITGWSAGFTDGDKPLEFSKRNAIRLLKARPDIQTLLEQRMDDHARFFALSSTGSRT